MPKFSVVISIYNKSQDCKATIQSVLDQSFEDFELIIVNDASTDKSEEVIKSFKDERIRYFKNDENSGAGATRNNGIRMAKCSYIALLDGDDLWYGDFLKEINKLISAFPNNHIFATAIDIEDLHGLRPAHYSFENEDKKEQLSLNFFTSSLQDALLHSSATVVSINAFNQIGTYDSTIKSGQDTDLWIRLSLENEIAFSTSRQAVYKMGKTSLYRSIGSVKNRPDYKKFKDVENARPEVKKFIDLNRYAQAIRAKAWNEKNYFKIFKNDINLDNLNNKQRFLLTAPRFVIITLWKMRDFFQKLGLRLSAFN